MSFINTIPHDEADGAVGGMYERQQGPGGLGRTTRKRSVILDGRYDEVDDVERARRSPSPQLVGSHQHAIFDLDLMSAIGARLVGRPMGVWVGVAQSSGSLNHVRALADRKMNRTLDAIDGRTSNIPGSVAVDAPERCQPTRVDELPTLRRRKSSFIHGREDDVRDLTGRRAASLDAYARQRLCASRETMGRTAGIHCRGAPLDCRLKRDLMERSLDRDLESA